MEGVQASTRAVLIDVIGIIMAGARGSTLGLTLFASIDVCFADSPVAFTAVTAI